MSPLPASPQRGPFGSAPLIRHASLVFSRVRARIARPITIRIDPEEVVVGDALRQERMPVVASADISTEDPLASSVAALGQALQAWSAPPGRANLVVSDHWLRPLLITLPDEPLSDDEKTLLVTHRFAQTYGGAAASWTLRWQPHGDGRLAAVGWPTELVNGINTAIAGWGGVLSSAVPESLDALRSNTMDGDAAWIVVAGARQANVMFVKEGVLSHWRCHRLTGVSADADAGRVALLVQQAAAFDGDACKKVEVIDVGRRAGWTEALRKRLEADHWAVVAPMASSGKSAMLSGLDFARPQDHEARGRRKLFAATALVLGMELGMLGWMMQSMEVERARLDDERVRLIKRLRPAAESALPKDVTSSLQAARAMVTRLSIPWEELLATLETVRGERIIVNSFRPDPAGRRIEITATASSFSDIKDFINQLNSSRVLGEASLLSESSGREPGISFVVAATWVGAK